jgi:pimeloyl-ACP methyl ester carboxylesterase
VSRLEGGRRAAVALAAVIGFGCGEDLDPGGANGDGPGGNGLVDEDPEALRADVVDFVFGASDLPTAAPDAIDTDFADDGFADVPGLARIDRVRYDVAFGLSSITYQYWPEAPNGQAIIYHLGHWQGRGTSKHVVAWLIDRGYMVTTIFMPLYGGNPVNLDVEFEGQTYYLRDWHEDLAPIEREGGNTFQLFFEPVARTIEHLALDHGFEQIAMMGLSGGGWTTDVYSALDPRVATTFSVAGSLPFRLRRSADIGEYEQLGERPFYDIATYMDLYFLAATGEPAQRHRQLLHQYDECCFAWDGRVDPIRFYESEVRERLMTATAGGDFRIDLIPDIERHDVFEADLEIIHREMTDLR